MHTKLLLLILNKTANINTALSVVWLYLSLSLCSLQQGGGRVITLVTFHHVGNLQRVNIE